MNISVCVGSSCHIRGSYRIIELMTNALKENGLDESVKMGASFCLGRCAEGVSVKIDDEIISGVTEENFNEVFDKYVLKK